MEGYHEVLSQRYGIPPTKGLMVVQLRADSPAAKAGMRAATQQVRVGFRIYPVGGDILVAFEKAEITSVQELATKIDHHKAGDKVTFTILRGSQKLDLTVTLQETPPEAR
jgi:S1-C subfamily serine protease